MPKYIYIIKTTGPIVRGRIEAEDVNDAIQTIEERNKEKGRQILAWIGPYSEEELSGVNVDMIKNMNNTIQLEQSQLSKLVAECTRTVLKEMNKPVNKVQISESDIVSMVAEGVKRMLREMMEPYADQEQSANLCIEYLNKSKELGAAGDYEGSNEMRNKAWDLMDGLDAASLEKVYNATQVNLKEGFGAGMKAVGQRAANDVRGAFGGPYRNYPGNYVDTFQDASYGEDYWKLGKALENGQQLDPNKVIKKVQKYANFGVISQDSAQKVIGLINSGDYQAAGHELCFGTMSMVDPTGETGKTGYEKRHGIRQM